MDEARDPVASQYERWSYPAPVDDLNTVPWNAPDMHFGDLRNLGWLYWPQTGFRESLDVLVVGCGTIAAACYAYLYPQARVVGIDVSAASLAHEEKLRQKHGLANLTLRPMPLEDVATLGAEFDFVACHGVLHHVVDPAVGLRALGGVLRRDGVIDLMVYGRYGREGVYMLQDMFRRMGLGQEPRDVQIVNDALAALGPRHPVRRYLTVATDLNADVGLVDTFLHPRDRAFTCGECVELTEQAGLVFQGWQENGLYHPDGRLPETNPFRAELERLPERDLWQAVELFDGTLVSHWFHVCRPERAPGSYVIQFADEAFLDYIPVLRITQAAPADSLRQTPALIARPPFPPAPLTDWQAAVLSQVDGQRTVRQCLEAAGQRPSHTPVVVQARGLFQSLWRMGYAVFRFRMP